MDPAVQGPVRATLVLTSLARTSLGGRSFLHGLSESVVQAEGIQVTLVLPRGSTIPAIELGVDCNVLFVSPLRGGIRVFRDILYLRSWSRRSQAHVVVVPHEWGGATGSAKLINVVQNVLYFHEGNDFYRSARSTAMRRLARTTSRFVTLTIAVSSVSERLWLSVTNTPTVVLPQGISSQFAAALNCGARKRNDSIVIVTGTAKYKHPTLAVQIARRLRTLHPSVGITVVGVPAPDETDPTLNYRAELSANELTGLFASTDIVILTSQIESFGLPAFEARAAGCRLVVSEGTAMAEWLGGLNGVAVCAPDPISFSDQVDRFMVQSYEHKRTQDFDWSNAGPRWVEHIERIGRQFGTDSPAEDR